jgi:hypothetical protein
MLHVGAFEHGPFEHLSARRQIHDADLVATLEQPHEQSGVNLAFKMRHAPAFALGLDRVESACGSVLYLGECAVVRPTQAVGEVDQVCLQLDGIDQRLRNVTRLMTNPRFAVGECLTEEPEVVLSENICPDRHARTACRST